MGWKCFLIAMAGWLMAGVGFLGRERRKQSEDGVDWSEK